MRKRILILSLITFLLAGTLGAAILLLQEIGSRPKIDVAFREGSRDLTALMQNIGRPITEVERTFRVLQSITEPGQGPAGKRWIFRSSDGDLYELEVRDGQFVGIKLLASASKNGDESRLKDHMLESILRDPSPDSDTVEQP